MNPSLTIDDVARIPEATPVAQAIVAAVLGSAPGLRYLVGDDVQVLQPEADMKDGYQAWFAPTTVR